MRFKEFLAENSDNAQIGETWTNTQQICFNVGLVADWEKTYARRQHGDARNCNYEVGTEVEITRIVNGAVNDHYVEFKTADGKQFFLVDDAFYMNFFHGTMEEWHKSFIDDLKD